MLTDTCLYFLFLTLTGQLEWQDKKSVMQGPSTRITRSLGCMVSIARTDQDMYSTVLTSSLVVKLDFFCLHKSSFVVKLEFYC